MKLRRLVVRGALLAFALALPLGENAVATPFSDVPANHWAYQYIQALAADGLIDGYPDGMFKGDRPLTRYEMAVIVARVVAKIQENAGKSNGPSREDLDRLQKLIDALKDELDALGVRVTNLEDALAGLDKRTKFAQSLSLHGVFLPNVTLRQTPIAATTVTNTTGAPVTTYYGAVVPAGSASSPGAVAAIDPYVNAFLATDDTNNPLTQADPGIEIRQDSRFAFAYQINDNLTVSLPVHILNFEYGGEFSQQAKVDIEPGVTIDIVHAGALSNLEFRFGEIDDMTSSRLGLAFRAPAGYNDAEPYELPEQPFQKGVEIKGTVGEGAFGLTEVAASFTRMDDVAIDTQPGVTDAGVAPFDADQYFFPVVAPQETVVQTSPAGVVQSDTFRAGAGPLAQVFLTQKAVAGSVYVSQYDGINYTDAGAPIGAAGALPAPAFTYNAAYNSVVFSTPLPPGSVIMIAYKGLSVSDNSAFERYMVHARANQKFKGYTGAEVGLTFNRIFDYDDAQTSGAGSSELSLVNEASPDGYGEVSDTVFGLDFQLPIPIEILGPGSGPVLFGEVAGSTFTPNYEQEAPTSDGATVAGAKLIVDKVAITAQYQAVGTNYFSGAPYQFYGNAPALFAGYKGNYLPDFFGFGNNAGINQQFDGQFTHVGDASPNVVGNPNLTFGFPIYNPLRAQGPEFYSAFAPNTQGETISADAPVRLGDLKFETTGSYAHLQEIHPDGYGALLYGPSTLSNVTEKYDTYGLGTRVALPVFGKTANVGVNGSYETLRRLDETPQQYYPIDPATGVADTASQAEANALFHGGPFGAGSNVSFYPNYVNVRHITIGANATLPLTRDLDLSASYSTQRYGGADGTTLTQNISERKDYYTGAITYTIPKTSSSLSFVARHYGYTDDVVQNFDYSENRQDINFTVRF